MNGIDALLEEHFRDLLHVTKNIVELPLEQEDHDERIAELQERQIVIRERIDSYRSRGSQPLSDVTKCMIQECLEIERRIHVKFSKHRADLDEKIKTIEMGNKAKKLYSQSYSQIDGYFVDKHQ